MIGFKYTCECARAARGYMCERASVRACERACIFVRDFCSIVVFIYMYSVLSPSVSPPCARIKVRRVHDGRPQAATSRARQDAERRVANLEEALEAAGSDLALAQAAAAAALERAAAAEAAAAAESASRDAVEEALRPVIPIPHPCSGAATCRAARQPVERACLLTCLLSCLFACFRARGGGHRAVSEAAADPQRAARGGDFGADGGGGGGAAGEGAPPPSQRCYHTTLPRSPSLFPHPPPSPYSSASLSLSRHPRPFLLLLRAPFLIPPRCAQEAAEERERALLLRIAELEGRGMVRRAARAGGGRRERSGLGGGFGGWEGCEAGCRTGRRRP